MWFKRKEKLTEIKAGEDLTFIQLEGTPIALAKEKDTYKIILGKNVIAPEIYTDIDKAIKRIRNIDVTLVSSIAQSVVEFVLNENKTK